MQHLLDFIHEHSLDEQLYLVAQGAGESIELRWRRLRSPEHWEARVKGSEEPWLPVHRSQLLDWLRARGMDMRPVESELQAVAVTQIVFADMVLCDARKVLGRDLVRRAVLSHRDFVGELRSALAKWTERPPSPERPSVSVIKGGGASTEVRRGHLSLVPAAL